MIGRLKVLALLIDEVHGWIRPHHDFKQWSSISTSQVNNLAHSRAIARLHDPAYLHILSAKSNF
jgi:hypothetical protein